MKRKVKRYSGEDKSFVEDYETLGKRAGRKENEDFTEDYATLLKRSALKDTDQKDTDYAKDSISEITAKSDIARAARMDKNPERIVSKKELEKSGLSLRDFLNRERGLKRRGNVDEDETAAERRMSAIGDKWREDKKAKQAVPAATKEEMDRRKKMERDQALETVNPEMAIIGGPSLRVLKTAAEALAARQAAKKVGQQMGKRIEPHFSPIKDITPRAEQIGQAPRKIGYEPKKIGMKKGGAVKKMASGGKTSSASSRGDGIAQRGKTKGRIC